MTWSSYNLYSSMGLNINAGKGLFSLSKRLVLGCILLFAVVFGSWGANRSWDDGAGDGKWSSPANWNGDILPAADDSVTIGGGYSVTVDADTAALGSLDIGDSVVTNTFAITVTDTGTGTGILTITRTVTSTADLDLSNANNDFTSVVITDTSGFAISLGDANAVDLGAVSTSGALSVTSAAGSISQSSTITAGTLSVTTSDQDIILGGDNVVSTLNAANSSTGTAVITFNNTATALDVGTIVGGTGTVSLATTTSGAISETSGTITAATLNVTSPGTAIVLDGANAVGTLNASNTSGSTAITFNNTSTALDVGTIAGGTGIVTLTTTTSGAISESGTITAATLNVTSPGTAIVLDGANAVGTLNASNSSGSTAITFNNTSTALDVGTIAGGTGIVTLTTTTSGAISESGTITAATLNVTSPGTAIVLDGANAVGTLNASNSSGSTAITFNNTATALDVGTIVGGTGTVSLTTTTSGAISETSGTITAATLNVTSPGTAIVLDGANAVGTLNASNTSGSTAITFNNTSTALDVGTIAGGTGIVTLTTTTSGAISESGTITAATLNVTSPGTAIVLDGANAVGTLNASNSSGSTAITFNNTSTALDVGTIAGGTGIVTLTTTTSGAISESGTITAATLNVTSPGTAIVLDGANAVGTLNASNTSGSTAITFNNTSTALDVGTIAGGTGIVTLTTTTSGAISESGTITAATLNVTSPGTAIVLDGANAVGTLNASNSSGSTAITFNNTSTALDVGTIAGGTGIVTLTTTTSGAISESGTITAATLNVTTVDQAITLTGANQVDTLVATNGGGTNTSAIEFNNISLNLAVGTVNGGDGTVTLTTTTSGTITGSAVITAATLNITTSDEDIILSGDNAVGTLNATNSSTGTAVIMFNNTATALNVGTIAGGTGTVTLSITTSGDINDDVNDSTTDITAGSLIITSISGVGNNAITGNLDLVVNSIDVQTTAGAIDLSNSPVSAAVVDNLITGDLSNITYVQSGNVDLTLCDTALEEIRTQGGAITITKNGTGTLMLHANGVVDSGNNGLAAAGGNVSITSADILIINGIIDTTTVSGYGSVIFDGCTVNPLNLILGAGNIALTGSSADLVITSAISFDSGITLQANRDVLIQAVVTTSSGNITITADNGGTSGVGGVQIAAAGQVNSGGNISITGSDLNADGIAGSSSEILEVLASTTATDSQIIASGTLNVGTGGNAPTTADIEIAGVIEAAGAITIEAERSILLSTTNSDISSTSDGLITLTANNAGGTAGVVTQADGSVVQTGANDIVINAYGDITIASMIADTAAGSITLTSTAGAIADHSADTTADLTADSVSLTAVTGIGVTDAVDLASAVNTVTQATTTSGGVSLNDLGGAVYTSVTATAGDISVTTVDASSFGTVTSTNGAISISSSGASGDLTFSTSVTSSNDTSLIYLDAASGALIINAAVNAGATAGDVTLNAGSGSISGTGSVTGDVVTADAAGAITLSTSALSLDVDTSASGNLSITETNAVELTSVTTFEGSVSVSAGGAIDVIAVTSGDNAGTNSYDVNLTTSAGNIVLTGVVTADNAAVLDSAGTIDDPTASDTTADLTADSVSLTAVTGIGVTDAVDLASAVNTVTQATTTSGGVSLNDLGGAVYTSVTATAGDISVTTVGASSFTTVTATNGAISISSSGASGDLTFGTTVTSSNNTSLIYLDAASGALVINAAVNAGATAGDVTLNAGSGSISGTGSITGDVVTADAAGAITLSTSALSLDVDTSASGNLSITETNAVELTSVTTFEGSVSVSAGGAIDVIAVTSGDNAGTNSYDVTLSTIAGGIAIAAGGITADNDAVLNLTGTVSDSDTTTAVNITAGNLINIDATTGIGTADTIEISSLSVDAQTTAGAIDLSNSPVSAAVVDNLITGDLSNITYVQSGNVDLTLCDTALEEIRTQGGAITITKNGTGTLMLHANGVVDSGNNGLAAAGGNVSITSADILIINGIIDTTTVSGYGSVIFDGCTVNPLNLILGAGNIALTGSSADLVITSAISFDSGITLQANRDVLIQAVVTTSSGNITITADNGGTSGVGGVQIAAAGQVNSGGNISITGSDLNADGIAGSSSEILEVLASTTATDSQIIASGTLNVGTGGNAPTTADIEIAGVIEAAGAITIEAERSILLSTTNSDISSTSDGLITLTANNAGGTAGVVTQADGSVVQTGANDIVINAYGDITIASMIADTAAGSITLTSTAGAIADHSADTTADLTADSVSLTAVTGIGVTDAVDLASAVNTVTLATTTSGGVSLNDLGGAVYTSVTATAGDISLTTVDASSFGTVTSTNGAISISSSGASGDLTFSTSVTSSNDTSLIYLDAASGALIINAAVNAGATAGDVTLNAGSGSISGTGSVTGDVVTADAAGAITLSTSALSLDVDISASGNLSITETNAVELTSVTTFEGSVSVSAGGAIDVIAVTSGDNAGTNSYDVNLTTSAGNIVLTGVVTADNAAVLDSAGTIDDPTASDTTADLTADSVSLTAVTGIGVTDAVDLASAVNTVTLATTTSGGVSLNDLGGAVYTSVTATAGDISVTTVDASSFGTVTSTNGAISISSSGASGDLTFSTSVTSSNDTSLIYLDAASGALIINAAVNAGATAGDVTLNAGSGSISGTGSVTGDVVTADAAGAITLSTSALSLDVDTSASGNLSITETNAVELTSVTTFEGSVSVSAGGAIDVIAVTSGDNAGTNSYDVNLTTSAGNIVLTGVVTADNAAVLDSAGTIDDPTASDTTADLTADSVSLTAVTGIGVTDAVDLASAVNTVTLATTTSGGVSLNDLGGAVYTSVTATAGDISVTTVGASSFTTVTATNGAISISSSGASGDLTFGTTVTSSNDTSLIYLDAASGALVISAAVNAGATAGDVTLNAGSGSISGTGSVTGDVVTADAAGAITLSTSALSLDVDTSASGNLSITETNAVELTSVTTFEGSVSVSAGGAIDVIAVTSGDNAGTNSYDVTLSTIAGGIAIAAGGITADNDAVLNLTGTVSDSDTTTAVNITAGNLINIDATTGIGTADTIEISSLTVDAQTTAGAIDLSNSPVSAAVVDNLITGDLSNITYVQSGNVDLTLCDTALEEIRTQGGAITITKNGTGTLMLHANGVVDSGNNGLAAAGGNVSITSADILIINGIIDTRTVSGYGSVIFDGCTVNPLNLILGAGNIALTGSSADLVITSAISFDSGITLQANRDVLIQAVVTTSSGNITITADNGGTSGVGGVQIAAAGQVNSGGNISITGSDLNADGIAGSSSEILEVLASTTATDSQIIASGTLNVGTGGNAPTTADIEIAGVIEAAGAITIEAERSILLSTTNSDISSTSDGLITLTANNAGGTAGVVTQADGSVVQTGANDIVINAYGDITIASMIADTAAGSITLTSTAGAIDDHAADTTADLTADSVSLTAVTGIGVTDAVDLATAINTVTLAATTSGGVSLNDLGGAVYTSVTATAGDISLTTVDASSFGTVTSTNGAISISSSGASGDLTFSTSVTSSNDTSLIYLDAASGALIINAAVNAGATAGDVTLNAGSGSISGTGSVTGDVVTADAAGAITLSTSALSLDVDTSAAGNIIISETNAVTLTSVTTSNGNINASAGGATDLIAVSTNGTGNVSITTTAGDIAVNSITAAGYSVNLTAFAAVTELLPDAGADIICADLVVVSDTGFGSADALETTVGTFDIQNATSGAIVLVDTDAIEVIRANQATTGDIDLSASGSITVSTNGVTATGSGLVDLDASLTAGSDLIITAAVDSGTGTLSLTADDIINLQADLTSSGADLTLSGTSIEINAPVGVDITTGTGGGDILVTGLVESASTYALGLTAGTGSVTFNDVIGSINRLGFLTVNSALNVTIPAMTASAFTQASGTGLSTFSGAINLNTADGFNLAGTDVEIQSSVTTTTNGVFTVSHTGNMVILAAGDMSLDGAFSQTGAGTVQTAGDITTSTDNISFNGTVELTGNVVLSSGATGGNISFNSDVFSSTAGTQTLDITAGTGSIFFNSTVGAGTRLGALTVQSAADLTFTGAVVGSAILQAAGTGTTEFTSTLNLDNVSGLDLNGTAFTFNNTVTTTSSGPVTITNSGPVTIIDAADFTVDGGFTIDGAGAVSLAGDITTTADDIIFDGTGVVTVVDNSVTPDVTLGSTNGNIRLDGDVGGAGVLSVDSGAGTLDFTNTVGAGTPLSGLIVTGSTGLTFANSVEIDDESLEITGTAVTFQNTLTTTNAGTVSIANTGNLTIESTAAFNLDGALSQTGAGNVYCDANITTSNDNIGINGAFYLDQNIVLSTGSGGIGNITFNSTIDGGSATVRNLILIAGTGNITLYGAVGETLNLNNLTGSGTDLSLYSIGDGTGSGIDGALTLTSTGDTILTGLYYRTSGNQDYNTTGACYWNHTGSGTFESSGGTITFDDVYLYYDATNTVQLLTGINTGRFVFYKGTLDLNGQTLATDQNGGHDFVVFGSTTVSAPLYSVDDPDWTTVGDTRFEYPDLATLSYDPGSANYDAIFSNLDGSTITVGTGGIGNFYINGTDLPATASWTLALQDNSASSPSVNITDSSGSYWGSPYNIAFNLDVAYSTVTSGMIAASIPVLASSETNNNVTTASDTGNTNTEYTSGGTVGWDFARPDISTAQTVWDNVVEIVFTENIENSNNEIAAIIGTDYFLGLSLNGSTGDSSSGTGFGLITNVYKSFDPITGTGSTPITATLGAGDTDTIYVQVTGTWNTDATGLSYGNADMYSSDSSGDHQTSFPDLSLLKSVLYDAGGKNPVRNYDNNSFAIYDGATDGAGPALVGVKAETAAYNATTTSDYSNGHNYFIFRFSEPMDYQTSGTAIGTSYITANSNTRVGDYGVDSSGILGHMADQHTSGTVSVQGLMSYTGIFDSGYITDFSGETNPDYINAIERTDDYEIRVDVAGYYYTTGSEWAGYLGETGVDLTDPNGLVFQGVNDSHVLDLVGNESVEINTGRTINEDMGFDAGDDWSTISVNYSGWDVDPPVLAPYTVVTDRYEIIPEDEDSNTYLDRFEFHFLDNAGDEASWDSVSGHQDTSGGLRDSSFNTRLNAFTFEAEGTTPLINLDAASQTFDTTVLNSIFSLVGFLGADDPYFSISFDDTVQKWDSLTKIYNSYDEDTGYLTDLAGNRLRSYSYNRAVENIPPSIALTLAAPGNNWGYVRFSESVYGNASASAAIGASDFTISGVSDLSITSISDWSGGTADQEFIFYFSDTLDENDILKAKINILPLSVYDSETNPARTQLVYRISDLGFNIVEPLWASDGIHSDDIREGTSLTEFDGTGKLMDRDILLQARINATSFQNLSMSLYFDADVPSDLVNNDLWLPYYHEELAPVGNYEARYVNATSVLGNGLQEFTIPSTDSEMETGNTMEFYFMLNNLPCVDLDDTDDIFSFHPWSFQIKDIRKQRGGVTILNNIINPLDGDEAVLMYDLEDPGIVTVQIFALNGNLVRILQRGRQAAGTYQYLWDGRNNGGNVVARGVYFIRVVGPETDEIRKVMVVK